MKKGSEQKYEKDTNESEWSVNGHVVCTYSVLTLLERSIEWMVDEKKSDRENAAANQ